MTTRLRIPFIPLLLLVLRLVFRAALEFIVFLLVWIEEALYKK